MARRPTIPAAGRTLAVLIVVGALLAAALAGLPGRTPHASACGAFLRVPYTYEAEQTRSSYLAALDAASANALLPGDPYFGLPPVERGVRAQRTEGAPQVPPTVLKAISWVESTMTMASLSTRFNSSGPTLVSFDCGYGIMQVTTGMTVPLGENNQPSSRQVSVATHYANNIARGAVILAQKWNQAPESRPIVGTDTTAAPELVENWYYAVWSYNGFTGPGANQSNHPLDPSFSRWPRERYRCDGTQSRTRYPYQELIWGCMASPPERDGALLWEPLPATLPDLTRPEFADALSIANWVFPYRNMDMPTPRPTHPDTAPAVASGFRSQLFARPELEVEVSTVLIRLNGLPGETRATIEVENVGSGILSWATTTDESWIVVDPPAGVALGADVTCFAPQCRRAGVLEITINPTLLPSANVVGTLRISSPNSSRPDRLVRVEVDADFEVGAPGTSRAE